MRVLLAAMLLSAPAAAADYVVVRNELIVAAPADAVWARVGGYCAIAEWLPTTCTLEGSGEPGLVRKLVNGTVVEPMVARTARSYTYWQTVGNLAAAGLHGTLAAEPGGKKDSETRLSYTLVYDQAALASDALRISERARLQARFAQALQSMKALAEAR
ncbi:hypothetical protein GCM10007973_10990 [Polymorphobacter multimanifer]|uniref:SRPBCC family protein n=1 Tax=Polymorphobacter multimanifer TaxID=1070431 RepID=A0A841L1E7_9SPHN|nr:SRPBCC family protein [Polymorphobacter multimanifer]MBB6226497.1 hypothetical protein [Polymorphobacter multimanifer]GGI75874.1 hypothetical protein GCM10007973_10990 [Polymorphobacter multimanifer]